MAIGSFPPCIPRINMTKFFCCNVRSGCLFLGYFSMVSSIILIAITIHGAILFMNEETETFIDTKEFFYGIIICDVVFGLTALVNFLMIQGVKKNKPLFMYPWIYCNFVCLIFVSIASIIVIIISIDDMIVNPRKRIILKNLISMVECIVFIALDYYCFGAVVSYCQKVIQDNSLTQHQRLQNENL